MFKMVVKILYKYINFLINIKYIKLIFKMLYFLYKIIQEYYLLLFKNHFLFNNNILENILIVMKCYQFMLNLYLNLYQKLNYFYLH